MSAPAGEAHGPDRPHEPLLRCLGLGLFAGCVAAGFSVGLASILRLSPVIAGVATGIVTAAFVTHARWKYGPGEPRPHEPGSPRSGP